MDLTDIAEFISLALTVPTIYLAYRVLKAYGPRAMDGVRHLMRRESVTETDFLVIGITVGFIGAIADNTYWGIAWGAEFLELESTEWWFSNGVWSNIPFRQTAGIAAAIFHLWPVIKGEREGYTLLDKVACMTFAASLILIANRS